jgi:hypothetical protein
VERSTRNGRPKLRWMGGMKADVDRNGLNIEDSRMCVHDCVRCRRVMHSKHILGCLNTINFGVSCARTGPVEGTRAMMDSLPGSRCRFECSGSKRNML